MKVAIKYLLGMLAAPLAVAFLLALVALALRIAGRRKLAGGVFAAGLLVAYFCSLQWVGDVFLAPLEARYPTLADSAKPDSQVTAIAVLGAWYGPRENLPVTAALDSQGLARITEGVRLANRYPSARLVVSGGALHGGEAPALGYARFAREFGISPDRVTALPNVFDTAQESHAIAGVVAGQRFILVTTASHMPRAMALMEREGVNPIPAPTAQRTSGHVGIERWTDAFLPSSLGLAKTEAAWHEYLGLAAIALGLD